MNGKDLFNKYIQDKGEYAKTILAIYYSLGNEVYTLLEEAEKNNKRLKINTNFNKSGVDEMSVGDITMV